MGDMVYVSRLGPSFRDPRLLHCLGPFSGYSMGCRSVGGKPLRHLLLGRLRHGSRAIGRGIRGFVGPKGEPWAPGFTFTSAGRSSLGTSSRLRRMCENFPL